MTDGASSLPEVTAPRRLLVLRHGQTDHNAAGLWQGQLDSQLSQLGHQQAKAAAEAIAALGPTRVVASDLSRAAQTGQEVADVCGLPLELDERWREIHVGEWAGLSGAQVREQYPEEQDLLLRGEDFRRGGTGESVADVADRVRAALDDLLAQMGPGDCTVVATHGVTGRTLAAELIGMDQQEAWLRLAGLSNCHWAELVEGAAGWRVKTWNVGA
jgi:broad specificity phosphatase PhoE